ncbi:MAG TPA: hypothetical protein VMD30_02985 [Tepidisphaeraceae bacterium]|nr:hypothetical protein [Tepidisphaeraceae bacterium]
MNTSSPGTPLQPVPQNRMGQPYPAAPPVARPAMPGAVPTAKPAHAKEEPLELVSDSPAPANGQTHASKIHDVTAAVGHGSGQNWKRKPNVHPTGAVRVKSFHGRLSDNGLEYLDNAINEWLDRHPDIDIKFVTSTEGMFDGKIKEPALILNLWY